MDRPGKLFFFTFLLPIILDGIFHKLAPKIFGPNMFGMFQKKDMNFKQIQIKKRWDRSLQLACIGSTMTATGIALKAAVKSIARVTGKSQGMVVATLLVPVLFSSLLRKVFGSKVEDAQKA
jgi:hypothetical protein